MAHDEMIPSSDYNTHGTVIHWPIGAEPLAWLTESADGCCELEATETHRRFQRYKMTAAEINALADSRSSVDWYAE